VMFGKTNPQMQEYLGISIRVNLEYCSIIAICLKTVYNIWSILVSFVIKLFICNINYMGMVLKAIPN